MCLSDSFFDYVPLKLWQQPFRQQDSQSGFLALHTARP